jgi:hypothetical protein
MILINEIEVIGNGRNMNYYKDKGYKITYNEKILIKVEDLMLTSSVRIECLCDICKSINIIKYYSYITNIERNGYYRCNNCAKLIRIDKIIKLHNDRDKSLHIVNKSKETSINRYGIYSYAKTDESKIKSIKTNMEKYGFNTSSKSQIVKDKMYQTNLLKYNQKYTFNVPEIKTKIKKTINDKYGVDNVFSNQLIKDKIKDTLIKTYGVDNPMKDSNIFYKAQKNSYKIIKHNDIDISYQGTYELDFINFCIENEIDFIKGPIIDYKLDEVERKYHSDFITYFGSFLDNDFDIHMKTVWKVDKFDLIVQNPPYQVQKETEKNKDSKNPKTQPIWQQFVKKSISLLEKDKYMVMVHPGGWRDLDGPFKEAQNLLKDRQMLYLNIHTFKDGLNMFGAKTNYDYYILKNTKNDNTLTNIICEDNSVETINIKDFELIPGENISYIYNLIAKEGEDKVNIISNSLYHTQSGEKSGLLKKNSTDTHTYPCVYMVSYKSEPTFWYSNLNKGHFGIPKVIWANGSSGVISDKDGTYGLTQFSRAIIDDVDNLEYIEKALKNQDFIDKVMLYKHGLGHKYNNKIISMLRKDFWKDFI